MQKLTLFLNKLSADELEVLHKILGTNNKTVDNITSNFSVLSMPLGGFLQTKLSYKEILDKIAKENEIIIKSKQKISEIERDIFQKLFIKEYEGLSVIEKEEFINNLEKNGLDKSQIASLTSMATITAAQVSGFGVYLLASSTVSAITGILGITLPFAFYTGMSSVIAVVIGPIGFLVLGYGAYRSFKHIKSWDEAKDIFKQTGIQLKKLTFGDMDKTTMVFKYIASMRLLKIKQKENEVNEIIEETKSLDQEKSKIISETADFTVKIETIELEIETINNTIHELKTELSKKLDNQDKLKTEVQFLNRNLTQLNENVLITQKELNSHLKDIDELKNN